MKSDPNISIPGIILAGLWETMRDGLTNTLQKVIATWGGSRPVKVD